ncbi:MAG: hypothetical protein H0T92_02090 [Pyrinomonadaceae bacterium]|nr:hypothetical protein [Pyrinomonadaceae bacterium]
MAKIELNILVMAVAALFFSITPVYAHGGEDHGDEKAPVVSAGAGMVTRVARIGDYEVTVKHPSLAPDKELAARLFVTRFATNEPIGNAQVVITLIGEEGAPVEAAAYAGSTPGIYEVKLPPLPGGKYKLAARVRIGGETETAQYGAVEVAASPPAAVDSESGWARTALIVLGSLAGLGLAVTGVYRVLRSARRDRIKGEAATV